VGKVARLPKAIAGDRVVLVATHRKEIAVFRPYLDPGRFLLLGALLLILACRL
jgi:hypothetical protein